MVESITDEPSYDFIDGAASIDGDQQSTTGAFPATGAGIQSSAESDAESGGESNHRALCRYGKAGSRIFWREPSPPLVIAKMVKGLRDVDGKPTEVLEWENHQDPEVPLPKISAKEVASLFDLLSRILKYSPEERISAEQVSYHPWCTGGFETAEFHPVEKVKLEDRIEPVKDNEERLSDYEVDRRQPVGEKRNRIMDEEEVAVQMIAEKKKRVSYYEDSEKQPVVEGQERTADDDEIELESVQAGNEYVKEGTQPITEPEEQISKVDEVRKPSVLASIGRALVFGAVIGVIWQFCDATTSQIDIRVAIF